MACPADPVSGRPPGRGRLIAVEGIDASGKSTVARLLADRLAADGCRVLLLDRRSGCDAVTGYVADHLTALRRLIWDYPPDAVTSELGFRHWSHLIGAWFHGLDHTVVRPALEAGTWVVADSWAHKYAARFALTVGLPAALQPFADLSPADAVVWLDVPPAECAGRRGELRATERGEWQGLHGGVRSFVDYQTRVRDVYARLAVEPHWRRAGAESPEATAAQAYAAVADRAVAPTGHADRTEPAS